MRTVWTLSAVAAGLWFVMFSPWTRDVVPFWPAMAFSSGVLALAGLWLSRDAMGEVFAFRCWHVPVGALSALGPTIGGLLRDSLGSFSPTFQLFGVVAAIVFIASLFMRPPKSAGLSAPAGGETNDLPVHLINDPV